MPEYEFEQGVDVHEQIPDGEELAEPPGYVSGVVRVVTEEVEVYVCDECGEEFDEEAGLNGHMSSHSDE